MRNQVDASLHDHRPVRHFNLSSSSLAMSSANLAKLGIGILQQRSKALCVEETADLSTCGTWRTTPRVVLTKVGHSAFLDDKHLVAASCRPGELRLLLGKNAKLLKNLPRLSIDAQ